MTFIKIIKRFFVRQSAPMVRISLLALAPGLLACGGDSTGPSIRKDVMWTLAVSPRGSSLAIGETLPLTVQLLDYDGNAITEDVDVSFTSWDSMTVAVDTNGVLTAKANSWGNGVSITVNARAGIITKQTTIYVGVTETPAMVDSIALMPVNGNPLLTVGAFTMVRPRILDANGNEIPGVYSLIEPKGGISFTGFFLDPASGFAYAGAMGTTWISATVFVNGRLFTDSVYYRTRYRDLVNVMIGETRDGTVQTTMGLLYSDNIFMGSDGRAVFMNTLRTPVDIVFERPAEVIDGDGGATGGDILALQPGMSASRRFTALGDYFFTVKSEAGSKRSSITVKTIE